MANLSRRLTGANEPLLKAVLVTVFKRETPILLITGSMLLEILLSLFNCAAVGNFVSRGACSPAFSPIQYA